MSLIESLWDGSEDSPCRYCGGRPCYLLIDGEPVCEACDSLDEKLEAENNEWMDEHAERDDVDETEEPQVKCDKTKKER